MSFCCGGSELPIEDEIEKYREVSAYVTREPNVLYSVHKDPPNPDLQVWGAFAVASLYFGTFIEYIDILIGFEVGKTPTSQMWGGNSEKTKTFLRQTSLLSRSLDRFSQTCLRPFMVKVVGPIIKTMLTLPPLPDLGDTDSTGREEIVKVVNMFITSLRDNLNSCPPMLRRICLRISNAAKMCQGNASHMVSSFIMLRCLTPSIAVPERYGLIEAMGISESQLSVSRNNLLLVSKVLQKLANGTRYGAEFASINEAFDELSPRFQSAIMSYASEPASTKGAYAPPSSLALEEVIETCTGLHKDLHRSYSMFHRSLCHLTPLIDGHAIVQKMLSLLPVAPPHLAFALAPTQKLNDDGVQETDIDVQYNQSLQDAHHPLEDLAVKLTSVMRTRCFRVCGMNKDRCSVLQIISHRIPTDPSMQHALQLYFIKLMDGIVCYPYYITMLVETQLGNSAARSVFGWLRKTFDTALTAKYKKNLKGLYFLNPPLWVKGLLQVFQPLVLNRVIRKISYAASVPSLLEELSMDAKRFPVSPSIADDCGAVKIQPSMGIALSEVMIRPIQVDMDYPSLPYQCINWIKMHGLALNGIFSMEDIKVIPESNSVQQDLSSIGLHSTAHLLVQFIAAIPGGLLGPQVMELLSAAADLHVAPEDLEQYEEMNRLPASERILSSLSRLPQVNLALTQEFFSLLHLVAINSASNHMTISKLTSLLTSKVFCNTAVSIPSDSEKSITKFLISQPAEFWTEVWKLQNG